MITTIVKGLLLAMGAVVVLPWDVALIPGPVPRINHQTEHTQPIDAPEYTRTTLKFPAVDGVECEAWLYVPKQPATTPPPVIVMGHGLVRLWCCLCCFVVWVERIVL